MKSKALPSTAGIDSSSFLPIDVKYSLNKDLRPFEVLFLNLDDEGSRF